MFAALLVATVLHRAADDSTTSRGSVESGVAPAVVAAASVATQRVDVMEAGEQWILSVRLANPDEDNYLCSIEISVDGKVIRDEAILERGSAYSYVHHIYKDQIETGDVKVNITKSNTEATAEFNYKLKPTRIS